MSRKFVYVSSAVLTFVFLAVAGISFWLLGTVDGAAWLIRMISGQAGMKIEFSRIDGKLWNEVSLHGIELHWEHGYAKAEQLVFEWQPMMAFTGNIAVNRLSASGVMIQDNRPEDNKPPDLGWPEVKGLAAQINAWIDRLEIKDFDYHRLEKTHITATRMSSLVIWHNGILSVANIILDSPSLNLRGTVEAGFRRPSFHADVKASPSRPFLDIDRFSLKAELLQGSGTEQIRGPVTISGTSGLKQNLDISSDIGLTKTTLDIHELRVKQANRQGTLNGKGEIDFKNSTPGLQLNLGIEHLDLSPEIKVSTDISGILTVKGDTENYGGHFTLSNKGDKKSAINLTGSLRGTADGIHLRIEKCDWLDGTLQGQLLVFWREGTVVTGELQARNLNPAVVAPDWRGVMNLNISARATRSGKGNLTSELSARILESRLRGKELTGEVSARMLEQNLIIDKLILKGSGFDINAHGDLSKRLSFLANITDLSGIVPDTKGRLNAGGWIRRNKRGFAGYLNAVGDDILAGQAHIKKAKIDARLSEEEGYPLHLRTQINGLRYERLDVRSAVIGINGNPESHDVKISLNSSAFSLSAELTGAYRKKIWQGRVMNLSGRDAAGNLRLQSPVDVYLSDDRFSFSPFVIEGTRPESLSVSGELTLHPLSGFVQAVWNHVNLARVSLWLENAGISGSASGNVHAIWSKGALSDIKMQSAASGTFTSHRNTVEVKNTNLQADWNGHGLIASIGAELSGGGSLETRITSSSPVQFDIPAQGEVKSDWRNFNLATLNPFLPDDVNVTGEGSGGFHSRWAKKDLLFLTGKINASGTITFGEHRIGVKQTALQFDINGGKTGSHLELKLAEGGAMSAQWNSAAPHRFSLPEEGDIEARWMDVDLSAFQQWLPQGLAVKGIFSGRLNGKLSHGKKVDISGRGSVSDGTIVRSTEKGNISAGLRDAEISWTWKGDTLSGDIALTLVKYGKAKGKFRLPVPAVLPLAVNKAGPITMSVNANVQEAGLLTSLFPGLIQESSGKLKIEGEAGGTWIKPEIKGSLQLDNAGAYFPPAGIRLEQVVMKGHFDKDTLIIDELTAKSGPGNIEGTAKIFMDNWKISHYEGTVTGKRFRTVYLPELQVETSPQLKFTGSLEKLSVNGEIEVPELFVYGHESSEQVQPSKDVVIVDAAEKPKKKKTPFALDIRVHIVFGKKVFIKAEGIDAQLGGDVYITAKSPDKINGKGLIKVIKGAYRRYGINLDIKRGRLIFGGLITTPALDVLAIRTVSDVKAGVTVTGTPQSPAIKLYSDPSMPDADILGYIVLGHPVGNSKDQTISVMQAAGFLLSRGESVVLQEKLKRTLGIDVLDIESGGGEVSRSLITVGKYLNPKLYISYGQSLFGDGNLFRLRYSISRHWEAETQSGKEMGGDLFYKIGFK